MERRDAIERERLRASFESDLSELRDVDDDETTDAAIEVAARTAARVQQLSRPELELDAKPPWHRTPAGKVGAIVAATLSALGALAEGLRQAGVFK